MFEGGFADHEVSFERHSTRKAAATGPIDTTVIVSHKSQL